MSTNMKAFAVLLTALFLSPAIMAQGDATAPAGAQPQTPATTTTKPAKTKIKKGKKMMKKGEKKMKKGKMEEKKGTMEEKKGATTPSNTPPANP